MSFGIIIGCSSGDFHFAKGCLASVKYFMPDIPVCLLIDGEVDTTLAEEVYNCLILRKEQIQNAFLKNESFGWGITKMNCFWESPFDSFIFLDADICVWGNIANELKLENYDMVIDQPQYIFDETSINTWFFDTCLLKQFDLNFNPDKYNHKYFCTGIFLAKKYIFNISWYEQLLNLSKVQPQLFKFGEMGMLNYMIFKSVEMGKLTIKNHYIQHICPDFDKKITSQIFSFKDGKPDVNKPMVLHYNGNRKPNMNNKLSYHEPMTYFRFKYYKTVLPNLSEKAVLHILKEEDKKFAKKIGFKDQIKNIFRPFFNFAKKV